ncbi:hypothetical protein AB5J49_08125 [Streptomyces sp. R28]|uniref:Uncharacterized protein n=1 Tax=Streptomyces sp. R28 TaxID=3238628 RepID=A0AB39PSE5_9ACTN
MSNNPQTDRTALRDRIRHALCQADGFGFAWGTDMLEPDEYGEVADAVLAVLPAVPVRPAPPAAVLREAAGDAGRLPVDDRYRHHSQLGDAWDAGRDAVVRLLRRKADGVQQPDTETRATWGTRPRCTCSHVVDEHSVYGCLDNCACEWMPKRKPMDPVHILGIDAVSGPGRVADEGPRS